MQCRLRPRGARKVREDNPLHDGPQQKFIPAALSDLPIAGVRRSFRMIKPGYHSPYPGAKTHPLNLRSSHVFSAVLHASPCPLKSGIRRYEWCLRSNPTPTGELKELVSDGEIEIRYADPKFQTAGNWIGRAHETVDFRLQRPEKGPAPLSHQL
jgi:hypothetical protein